MVTKKGYAGAGTDRPVSTPLIPSLRVVISCVTFETVKVVKPIHEMRAEKVYILHWDGKEDGESPTVYGEFYHEVVRQLKEIGLKYEDIIEKKVRIFRFKEVLAELVSIMTLERDAGNDVFINVSAGSMEFAAASTLASMMVNGVRPFTVSTKEYLVSGEEKIRATFYQDGKPMGQSKDVFAPAELPTYQIDLPPRDLVVGLKILRKKKEIGLSTSYTAMIKAIEEAGCWRKVAKDDGERDERQTNKMYYSRHFIDGWTKRGWVEGREGRSGVLSITESGKNVTDIFYKK